MTPCSYQGVLPPLPPGGPFRPEFEKVKRCHGLLFFFCGLLCLPWAPGAPPGPPLKSPKTHSGRLLPSLRFLVSSFPPSSPVSPLQGHRLGPPYATFTNKHNGFPMIPFPSQRGLTHTRGTQKVTPGPTRPPSGIRNQPPRRPGAPPVLGQKRPDGVQNASGPQKTLDHL